MFSLEDFAKFYISAKYVHHIKGIPARNFREAILVHGPWTKVMRMEWGQKYFISLILKRISTEEIFIVHDHLSDDHGW